MEIEIGEWDRFEPLIKFPNVLNKQYMYEKVTAQTIYDKTPDELKWIFVEMCLKIIGAKNGK